MNRHEFVCLCCLSGLPVSRSRLSLMSPTMPLPSAHSLWSLLSVQSHCSVSCECDGHDAQFFACCRLPKGPTDSLDTLPSFQFEHGLSSFAKLMWQADFSCPSENFLVAPRFSLDLASTSILLVVVDHLLAAYTSIDGAGRRLRFSGIRPGLNRKSNETRSTI